ncbi:MAG: undecaprenyl/decaprenyl-phosphate alpha-N-acetylglucosaminyl 1-phosphate transferase [Ruminococcaceae bacterium]|nr:undecaprenyl/decaprenyl-phosphate alpha-N-acetylglucosaminyl 1-phosphate transferase [Oscillospiraceae bacterium]
MSLVHYVLIAGAFFIAAAFVFFVTPAVRIFAFKIGAVDIPRDERRMHSVPIARLGGLGVFAGFIVSIGFYLASSHYLNLSLKLVGILAGASIIIILGIIDDITPLKAGIKFVIQIIAAAIPVFCGMRIDIFENLRNFAPNVYIPIGWLSIIFTIFWIVGITNAVNFIDGLDGLAAGISGISTVSMVIIMLFTRNVEMALLAAALSGACIGFIPFNFNPAKIFMGDTGATFLGFMLACVSIQGLFGSYLIVSFAVPFLLLALPIFDTTYAIIRRIRAGQSPMAADRNHIHHRLIDFGLTQKQVVLILYMFTLCLCICAIAITFMGIGRAMWFVIILFVLMLIAIIIAGNLRKLMAKKERKNKGCTK